MTAELKVVGSESGRGYDVSFLVQTAEFVCIVSQTRESARNVRKKRNSRKSMCQATKGLWFDN